MNQRLTRAALFIATAMVMLPPAVTAAPAKAVDSAQLRTDMRKLWEDHITWTRLYIVSVAAGLPDKDVTAQRLLQNQVDIGNAVKPFYGDDAGNKLTGLLKEHILGAADLLAAAKANDQAKVATEKARWYRNADDIAAFLSTANPKNWPAADMKAGMKMHLDLTLEEALHRFGGKYAEDVQDYDRVHEHILGFADLLTNGIAAQFPDRVKKS
jgi:hypothetical protein